MRGRSVIPFGFYFVLSIVSGKERYRNELPKRIETLDLLKQNIALDVCSVLVERFVYSYGGEGKGPC